MARETLPTSKEVLALLLNEAERAIHFLNDRRGHMDELAALTNAYADGRISEDHWVAKGTEVEAADNRTRKFAVPDFQFVLRYVSTDSLQDGFWIWDFAELVNNHLAGHVKELDATQILR